MRIAEEEEEEEERGKGRKEFLGETERPRAKRGILMFPLLYFPLATI